MYSSLPGRTASCSYSSNPEYTPQVGDSVDASTARIANIARSTDLQRGVQDVRRVRTKKLGRM